MAISKENKRVLVTMPKDLYDKITKLAEKENRSISNLIVTKLMNELHNSIDEQPDVVNQRKH